MSRLTGHVAELVYQEMWACVSRDTAPDWIFLRLLQEGVKLFL